MLGVFPTGITESTESEAPSNILCSRVVSGTTVEVERYCFDRDLPSDSKSEDERVHDQVNDIASIPCPVLAAIGSTALFESRLSERLRRFIEGHLHNLHGAADTWPYSRCCSSSVAFA
jgi:hypothetical protein